MNSFGEAIRQSREKKGLYLREVAAAIKIDQGIISKLERGERRASRDQVLMFIRFYNLNLKETLVAWLSDNIANDLVDEEYAKQALNAAISKIDLSRKNK
jgi:HTH-type transcriptional regulator, competence development regulator